mgnify:CR=1 FL=1
MVDADRDGVLEPGFDRVRVELELPLAVAEFVARQAALSGRSEEEIIIALLDQALSN